METMEQDRIFELMRSIDRARRAWKSADPKTRINRSQFFTLMILRNKGKSEQGKPVYEPKDPFGPMTLSGLAAAMHQTMPAVSQRITQLEKMGYVERVPDKNDRRTVWIGLTEEGNDVLEETRKIMFQHMARIMDQMEEQQPQSVENLISGCNCLADAVKTVFQI